MEAIDYLIKLKNEHVRLQNFEICFHLRDIENKFKGDFNEVYLYPNYDNLKNSLQHILGKEKHERNRNILISIIRDIKIKKLIGEI